MIPNLGLTAKDVVPIVVISSALIAWIYSSRPEEHKFAKGIIEKFFMYCEGSLFMVFSSDSKGLGPKKNPDPEKIRTKDTLTKKIIFIRHGESDWNDVFNKGKNLGMIKRIAVAMWKELWMYPSKDSVFMDSALNTDGFEQAKDFQKYLFDDQETAESFDSRAKEILDVLRGSSSSTSLICASNLRRCIQTTTTIMWPRLQRTKEKIHICSSLQEISRNVDTKSLTDRKEIPDVSRLAKFIDGPLRPGDIYDASMNNGNKTYAFNGIKRMKAFNEWAFTKKVDTIIVGGHSLWFKHYFNTFLPFDKPHKAKQLKMKNTGAVSFTLHRTIGDDGTPLYRVDESDLMAVYLGFEKDPDEADKKQR